MIQIPDALFNGLRWKTLDAEEADAIITGMEVVGAEPVDYPDTDGLTIYMRSGSGELYALDIGTDPYQQEKQDTPLYIRLARITVGTEPRDGATGSSSKGQENMGEKIKKCPHCGADAYLQANYSQKTGGYFVMCKCEMCGAQGKIFNSPEDPEESDWSNTACIGAVKAWNMRVKEEG